MAINKNNWIIISVSLVLLLLTTIWRAILFENEQEELKINGIEVWAEIISIGPSSIRSDSKVKYEYDFNGNRYEDSDDSPNWLIKYSPHSNKGIYIHRSGIGDSIKLLVSKNNPSISEVIIRPNEFKLKNVSK